MVRYCGWYSSRSRGERIKAGVFRPGDEPASPEGWVLSCSVGVSVVALSLILLATNPCESVRDFRHILALYGILAILVTTTRGLEQHPFRGGYPSDSDRSMFHSNPHIALEAAYSPC
jgi:hypothetical protein